MGRLCLSCLEGKKVLGSRYVYSPIYGNYILAFALSMKIYAHEIIKKERKLKVAVT